MNTATKGAAWLDENYPGWKEKINCDNLNLNTWRDCILGQLKLIGVGLQKEAQCGGWLFEHGFVPIMQSNYAENLTQEWKDVIGKNNGKEQEK